MSDRETILARLQELARFEEDGSPVISLYLDTLWDSAAKREAVRLFVKDKLRQVVALHGKDHPWHDSLAADAERIRRRVEELVSPVGAPPGRGLAIFASHARGLWLEIPAPRPFENQLVVRTVPHVFQLARLVDDYQTAILCQVDSRSARILEFVFGGLAGEEKIDHPDVPGRHHQGGWSQMRYQRHVDWHREKHVREVADVFVRLADGDPMARLFLSGPPEPLAFLKSALPKRILERQPTELGLELGAEIPEVMRAVLAGIEEKEREEEARHVRETLEEALAGGLAAAGPAEVAAAANHGAVSLLLVLDGARVEGWRCPSCSWLGTGEPPAACPACGGEGTQACDLVERLVEKVLASGGDLDVIHESEALAEAGGVAAKLRFRA